MDSNAEPETFAQAWVRYRATELRSTMGAEAAHVAATKEWIRPFLKFDLDTVGRNRAEALQLQWQRLRLYALSLVDNNNGWAVAQLGEAVVDARRGDPEARYMVRHFAEAVLRKAGCLPACVADYVADHLAGKLPPAKTGRPREWERTQRIGGRVAEVATFGFHYTRNETSKHKHSAALIVAQVLAELGSTDDSEESVVRAWEQWEAAMSGPPAPAPPRCKRP